MIRSSKPENDNNENNKNRHAEMKSLVGQLITTTAKKNGPDRCAYRSVAPTMSVYPDDAVLFCAERRIR